MKKLFGALLVLTSFSVLTRALGFFFRIYLSRVVGAESLGVYQIAFSVFMVLETVVSSGIPLIISKKTAENSQNSSRLVSAGLVIGSVVALILCAFVFLFKNIFSGIFTDERCLGILFLLLPSLVFSSVYSVIRGNFWGNKKFFLVSFTEFFEQVSRIALSVLFLGVLNFSLDKVFLASISYSLSCIVSSVLVFLIYIKGGGRLSSPRGNIKQIVRSSSAITFIRVISSLITPIISIIIPLRLVSIGYTNEQALALFGVAVGMTFPLLYVPSTLTGSLSMTLIPNIASSASTQNFDEVKNHINFSIKFTYFVSFLFISIYSALGKGIGYFFFANSQAGAFLSAFSFLVLPICLSSITTSSLNALNMEVKSFINYVFGGILLVFSIGILPELVGVMAISIGMALSLGLSSFLNIIFLNKKVRCNFFNTKYLALSFICAICCHLMSKWVFNIVCSHIPLFFALVVAGMVGSGFYCIMGEALGIVNISSLRLMKKKKLQNKGINNAK